MDSLIACRKRGYEGKIIRKTDCVARYIGWLTGAFEFALQSITLGHRFLETELKPLDPSPAILFDSFRVE